MASVTIPEKLQMGPKPDVIYPVIVKYCGNCSMPIEVRLIYRFKLLLLLI